MDNSLHFDGITYFCSCLHKHTCVLDLLQKFEIGGLTSELYKMMQLWVWVSGKLKGSQLYEDLFSFHQNVAWRLLTLAQDHNYFYRQKAVHSLARMPSLSGIQTTKTVLNF